MNVFLTHKGVNLNVDFSYEGPVISVGEEIIDDLLSPSMKLEIITRAHLIHCSEVEEERAERIVFGSH